MKKVSITVPVAHALRKGETGLRTEEVVHVLGPRLSMGEADSARPRGHLRPTRPRPPPPRRRPHRGPRHGCLPPRSTVAPRARRRRPPADPRTIFLLPAPTAGPRGHRIPGRARQHGAT